MIKILFVYYYFIDLTSVNVLQNTPIRGVRVRVLVMVIRPYARTWLCMHAKGTEQLCTHP